MIQNNYDRCNIITFFEPHMTIDIDIMNAIPTHVQYADDYNRG